MSTKLNIGPSLGGLGIGAVALSSTITIEETGTVYDRVIEVVHSPCAPRQVFPVNGWGGVNELLVPTGLGQAPAGVLIVPPATNYAIEVRLRPHNASETTTYYFSLHRNAPFLWYFDLAFLPTYLDLYWGGQNYSTRGPCSFVPATGVFTDGDGAHSLVANEVIRFVSGTPPAGFSLNTPYYIRSPSGADFELAATPNGDEIVGTGSVANLEYATDNGFLLQWL